MNQEKSIFSRLEVLHLSVSIKKITGHKR